MLQVRRWVVEQSTSRLLRYFVIMVLVPLALTASATAVSVGHAVEQRQREDAERAARTAAELVSRDLEGRAAVIRSYAERRLLQQSIVNETAGEAARHLRELHRALEGAAVTALVLPGGAVLATYATAGVARRRLDAATSAAAADAKTGAAPTDGVVFAPGPPAATVGWRGGHRVVSAVVPVTVADSGARAADLVVFFDLSLISRHLDDVIRSGSITVTQGESVLVAAETRSGTTASAALDLVPWEVRVTTDGRGDVVRVQLLSAGAAIVVALLLGLALTAVRAALRLRDEATAQAFAASEAAGDAFLTIDVSGRILAWNRRAEELFGWTDAEARGARVTDLLLAPEARNWASERLAGFAGGGSMVEPRRTELDMVDKSGRLLQVEAVLWSSTSGGEQRISGFLHDVSDRIRAGRELAEARDHALETTRLKSEFLAMMSHEIRTPMSGIIGMTDLLLATGLDPSQRRYAGSVQSSAVALLDLLNDLLDFSKIEAGRMDLESVDFELRSIVADVARLFGEAAALKGVELVVSVEPTLTDVRRGDPGRLRQVLANLVGNAVKFTDKGEVVVTVAAEPGAADSVRFDVADTGVGVEESDLERLFTPFTQADTSTSRRYGGTGLGLPIARQLVEAMGGSLTATSQRDHGSTFSFSIPLPAGDDPTPPGPRLTGARVLVVEAASATLDSVVIELRASGADVVASRGGGDSLRQALAVAPDVVVVGLPLGEDTPEADLANAVAGVPVVLLSSSAERASSLGGDAQIRVPKPVSRSELLAAVAQSLGRETEAVGAAVGGAGSALAARPGARVLVADDNELNRRLAVHVLEAAGYHVRACESGEAALEALAAETYDILLLDCHMPGLDGYEVARRLVRDPPMGRRLPVVGVSASAAPGDEARALQAGMDDYLVKPYRPAQLLEMVGRHVLGSDEDVPAGELLNAGVVQELADDPALLAQLVDLFRHDAGARVDELVAAAAAGDGPTVRARAHRLRGSAGALGADRLAELCRMLEEDEGDDNGHHVVLSRAVADEYRRALAALVARTDTDSGRDRRV